MKFKIVFFVLIFLLTFNVIYALIISSDSLKYFVGKLQIIEKRDKNFSPSNANLTIVSNDFSNVLFKPKIFDSTFKKTIPYATFEQDRENLEVTISSYFQFPNYDELFKNRIFLIKDKNILITLMSDVWGFKRIFYALCFWEINNNDLKLINIINEPLTVGIGGISIIDCFEIEKDEFILILHSESADGAFFWGNYKIYQCNLSNNEHLNEIYKVEYNGDPKAYTRIEKIIIDYSDIKTPHIKFDKVTYKSDSEEEYPKDHKIVECENIEIDIINLLKSK